MNGQDWSPPHSHDPNPMPPSADPTITLSTPRGDRRLTPQDMNAQSQQFVPNCYIVSTGHGTTGPFTFGGVTLNDLITSYDGSWRVADIISADGFRTRVTREELEQPAEQPILLATTIDGRPMRREEGLVRLIVPGETDDALRQVKWVSEIRLS